MEKNSLVLILPVMLLKFIAIKPLTLYKLLSVTRGDCCNKGKYYQWYTILPYQMVHPFTI
jgi:hypothetical protein